MQDDKSMIIKIGRATDMKQRLQSYHTSLPNAETIYEREVSDAILIEDIIHSIYGSRKVWKRSEWFFCIDDNQIKDDVDNMISFIEDIIDKSDKCHPIIRRSYVNDEKRCPLKEDEIKKHPSERTRSKSPSKKSIIEAKVKELKDKGEYKRGDRKKVENKIIKGESLE